MILSFKSREVNIRKRGKALLYGTFIQYSKNAIKKYKNYTLEGNFFGNRFILPLKSYKNTEIKGEIPTSNGKLLCMVHEAYFK